MKLGRFVDGEPGQQRTRSHTNDAGVGDALCSIKLTLRRVALRQAQIVQCHLDRFHKRMPGGQQLSPLAGEEGVQDIRYAVQSEEPREEKVIAQSFRKLKFKMEIVVEPWREKPEERPATEPNAIDPVCVKALVL